MGDEIHLFDGRDASFEGRIETIAPNRVEGVLLSEKQSGRDVSADIVLCQGLIKGARWDWLLEKACEIGVARVIPLLTRRTVVKATLRDAHKLQRWANIALAASKQCGRSTVMTVDAPISFMDSWPLKPADVPAFIPWEKEETFDFGTVLGKRAWLFVGPEGGWDSSEVEMARRCGARPVHLGPTLLRSETAGIVAATLLLKEMGIY